MLTPTHRSKIYGPKYSLVPRGTNPGPRANPRGELREARISRD